MPLERESKAPCMHADMTPAIFYCLWQEHIGEFGIESSPLTILIAGRTLPTHCVVAFVISPRAIDEALI